MVGVEEEEEKQKEFPRNAEMASLLLW